MIPSWRTRPRRGSCCWPASSSSAAATASRAAAVLRRAARRYPGDFRIHFELALALGLSLEERPYTDELFPEPEEAVRHLTTATGIRPASVSTHLVLGAALLARGNPTRLWRRPAKRSGSSPMIFRSVLA